MNTKSRLQVISDYLDYVALYAPNFPTEDRTDLQKSFQQIFQAIEAIMPLLKDPTQKQSIEVCLKKIKTAYQDYISGQIDSGEKLLRNAIEYFDNAVNKKTKKAKFAIDPSGNVGEFNKKNSN